MIRRMVRIAVCLLLVACSSKKKDDAPANVGSAGSGGVAAAPEPVATTPPAGPVPALRWTDPDGELLLATGAGSTLEGPCGMTGTITSTDVELAGQKEAWTKVTRQGRAFSLPKLDWVIEVSAAGDVVHKRGGTETPLGKVTGADTDDALAWFGALVIGAPMIQHRIGLQSPDGSHQVWLSGAADLRAWDAKDEAGARVASRNRDDAAPVLRGAKPAHDPSKLSVEERGPRAYQLIVADDGPTRALLPGPLDITEAEDGTLTWKAAGLKQKPSPLGTLVDRKACKAHDRAVPALIWAYLASDKGVKAAAPPKVR